MRIRVAIIGTLAIHVALGQTSGYGEIKAMAEPKLPFYDWGACPGEFRCYGDFLTAPRALTVYDTDKKGRRPIGQVGAGEKVAAINGVVITFKPGLIRMDRDLPERDLRRGDTLLTYTYRGEGYQTVWFKGKFYSEFDISFSKWPNGTCSATRCSATYVDWGTKSWWVQIKLTTGGSGWVEMEIGQPSGL